MSAPAWDTRTRDWGLLFFGIVLVLVGLFLGLGGARLAALGGSWYYLLAGVGIAISGVLVTIGRRSGAWLYGAVVVATLFWAAWESGLDYWRWIPRVDLVIILAFFLALLLPRFRGGPSRAVAGKLAVGIALVMVVAFALAFVPQGVYQPDTHVAQAAAIAAPAAPLTSATLQPKDAPADADWGAYGRNNAATRYSPLAQIDRGNVAKLERVWTYRTGDLPEERWGAETTPLKIGDTLYLCSARNILIALDAGTGEERWRHDPKIANQYIPYTAACRGVTYYEVPSPSIASCAVRIFEGTLDGRLIAVDSKTGKLCADFGQGGQVDITEGMGQVSPGMVSITSAPTIVRGVIVTGHQVLDGERDDAPSGVIQGFDAVTGELRWAWDLARPDRNGLPPDGETYTRGTPNSWTTATGDERLGYVYLPLGNSAADYWSSSRTAAENAYSSSLVALDATTGKPAWNFQTVHVDVWDYDLGSQATLVDFPGASGPVPAAILTTKQGDVYVLDRRTGEPLTALEERPVPQGGAEPERRSPTQPFSLYHTLAQDRITERDMWGLTPFDQLACRIEFRAASYAGMYTPPVAEGHWIQYTGYNGGVDWGGIAVDPRRGLIIANYNDMPNYNRLVPRARANELGWVPRDETPLGQVGEAAGDPQAGTPYAIEVNAGWRRPFTGLLCKEPPYGGIRAIELATGRTVWDRPFGTARANGPFGIPSHLPIVIGTPNNGGSAVTAGGLVFIAAATDNLIRAIDIETGETVWQDVLPAGGQANPIVYEVAGREYLVIMAGGHHFMETPGGDYVIAYSLPRD